MPNFRHLARPLVAAVMLAAAGAPALSQGATLRTEPLFEPFDRLSPATWYISDGWSNGDHQNCTWSRRAIDIEDGKLILNFIPAPDGGNGAICGEVQTHNVFGHGVFEARMRAPLHSGMNAAFFTYIGRVHGQPHDEIDFELLTRYRNQVSLARYVDGDNFGETGRVRLPEGNADEFHDYAFIWAPDSLRWYVDGILVRETTDNLPLRDMKIYFSHWGTDTLVSWMGEFETPDAPLSMEIDWLAYTPLDTPCAFDESILCHIE